MVLLQAVLLIALVTILTPGQVDGLIPPRYDPPQGRWWQPAELSGSGRHQTTSYSVYNSAGPLPVYSFAGAAPKPSCQSRCKSARDSEPEPVL